MNRYNGKKRSVEDRVVGAMEKLAIGTGIMLIIALYCVVSYLPNGVAG
jgi:hypothetical protein